MSANELSRISTNVNTVYECLQKGEASFLDQELNVTKDSAQEAKLLTLILYMQSHVWCESKDDIPVANKVRFTLAILYKEDPLSKHLPRLFFESIQAFNQRATLLTYAKKVHEDLSKLYEGRMIFKEAMEDTLSVLKTIKIEQRFLKAGYKIVEKIEDFKLGRAAKSVYHFDIEWISTTSGYQFFLFNLFGLALFRKVDDEKIKEKMKGVLETEKDVEICKIAHTYLIGAEYSSEAQRSSAQGLIFGKLALPLLDPKDPHYFNSYFSGLREYFDRVKKYMDDQLEKMESGTFSEFYEIEEYEARDDLLKKFEEEVRDSEGIYQFLRSEWDRIREGLTTQKQRKQFIENYGKLKFSFLIENGKRALPSHKDYCSLNPKEFSLTEWEIREEKFEKLREVSPEIEPSLIPSNSITISLEEGWKVAIQFDGGLEKPFFYAERVTRWYECAQNALVQEGHASKTQSIQEKITFFHAFPSIIDQFVGSNYCFTEEHSGETLYAIPTEIFLGGTTYRGFFQYTVNHGICYHRCFGDRTDRFTNALWMGKVWEASDFPTIEEADKIKKSQIHEIPFADTVLYLDPVFGTIQIRTDNATINLFRVGPYDRK